MGLIPKEKKVDIPQGRGNPAARCLRLRPGHQLFLGLRPPACPAGFRPASPTRLKDLISLEKPNSYTYYVSGSLQHVQISTDCENICYELPSPLYGRENWTFTETQRLDQTLELVNCGVKIKAMFLSLWCPCILHLLYLIKIL